MTESVETEDSNQKVPLWQVRKTCWVSTEKQCTEGWALKRIGCIQASLISKICGRSNYQNQTPEEIAQIVCGLSKESFSLASLDLMEEGIRGEPVIKKWYSDKIIYRPITDVGVAVWKKNPFFRASLDGETTTLLGNPAAVEVKIPKHLNSLYIDVLQSWGKGLNNPHPSTYIFASHYDQMTAGSVITDKHGCYYVVACVRDGTCFHQYIETDYEHWNKTLYPTAEAFRLKYVVPLLERHNIEVVMPPGAVLPYDEKVVFHPRRDSEPSPMKTTPPRRGSESVSEGAKNNPPSEEKTSSPSRPVVAYRRCSEDVLRTMVRPIIPVHETSPIKMKPPKRDIVQPIQQLVIRNNITSSTI